MKTALDLAIYLALVYCAIFIVEVSGQGPQVSTLQRNALMNQILYAYRGQGFVPTGTDGKGNFRYKFCPNGGCPEDWQTARIPTLSFSGAPLTNGISAQIINGQAFTNQNPWSQSASSAYGNVNAQTQFWNFNQGSQNTNRPTLPPTNIAVPPVVGNYTSYNSYNYWQNYYLGQPPFNPDQSYYGHKPSTRRPTQKTSKPPTWATTPSPPTTSTGNVGTFAQTVRPDLRTIMEVMRLFGGMFKTMTQNEAERKLVTDKRFETMSKAGVLPVSPQRFQHDMDFCCPTNFWHAKNDTVTNIEGMRKLVIHLTQLPIPEYQFIPHGTCVPNDTYGRCGDNCLQEFRIHYLLVSEAGVSNKFPPVSFDRVMVPSYCSCKNPARR